VERGAEVISVTGMTREINTSYSLVLEIPTSAQWTKLWSPLHCTLFYYFLSDHHI